MSLGRDALLRGSTLKRETVEVGALGGAVVLRRLSLPEQHRCHARFRALKEDDIAGSYKAALAQVVTALCNDDGAPMFGPEEVEATADALYETLDPSAADKLIAECSRVQGVDKDAIKEALGNSEGTPSGPSS